MVEDRGLPTAESASFISRKQLWAFRPWKAPENRQSPAALILLDRIQESILRLFKVCSSLHGEQRDATAIRCKGQPSTHTTMSVGPA